MLNINYKNGVYTINELSELSGIEPPTLRYRLRNGYSIEEAMTPNPIRHSIREFCKDSWYEDWIGMSTSQLYQIYWKWCIKHKYTPLQDKVFTRDVMRLYPILKVVPMKDSSGNYHRVIRLR